MPVYVFYGRESLARGEAVDGLRRELDGDGGLSTNTIVLEAARSSVQEVTTACDTLPFLGDRRLVIVYGALSSAGKSRKGRRKTSTTKAAEAEPPSPWLGLVEYVPRMPESTVLILVDDDAPAKELLDALGPFATVRSFGLPGDKELPGWIIARAQAMDIKIDLAAARLLAELIGTSEKDARISHMPLVVSELNKLAAYANGQPIRTADVTELVGRAKEHKAWELTDAIIAGKGATAARVLEESLEDGSIPAVLLSTVAGRYRRLAIAKDIVESGGGSSEVTRACGTKPGFGTENLIAQAERISWDEIRAAYGRIIDAEIDVKRDNLMEDQLALEIVVQELAAQPARRRETARSR